MIKLICKEFFKNLIVISLIYIVMFNYIENKIKIAIIFIAIAITTAISKVYKNKNKK